MALLKSNVFWVMTSFSQTSDIWTMPQRKSVITFYDRSEAERVSISIVFLNFQSSKLSSVHNESSSPPSSVSSQTPVPHLIRPITLFASLTWSASSTYLQPPLPPHFIYHRLTWIFLLYLKLFTLFIYFHIFIALLPLLNGLLYP